ncbi:unnamed protein product, partial [Didymodactylos carnosus]
IYRLQRNSHIWNKGQQIPYVNYKTQKQYPIMSLVACLFILMIAICGLMGILLDKSLLLVLCIVSSLIMGSGLIILGVIILGFIENISENYSYHLEALLVNYIEDDDEKAKEELRIVENSNECCASEDPKWLKVSRKECRKSLTRKIIYSDFTPRGCTKLVIIQTLSILQLIILDITTGCLTIFLGIWTVTITCRIIDQYDEVLRPLPINTVDIENQNTPQRLLYPVVTSLKSTTIFAPNNIYLQYELTVIVKKEKKKYNDSAY